MEITDKQRLDFIQENLVEIRSKTHERFNAYNDQGMPNSFYTYGETVRESIDAAIRAMNQSINRR